MDNFILLKLNRAIWVAFLEQGKIVEAANHFEMYKSSLLTCKGQVAEDRIQEELYTAQVIFNSKLKNVAVKFYNDGDYANALIAYTTFFKYQPNDEGSLKNYIQCLRETKQFDLEISLLEYLEQIAKDNIEIYSMIADAYDRQNNNYKSTEMYEKYMKAKGEENLTPEDYNFLGCYYNKLYSDDTHKKSDIMKSLDAFEKASDMVPHKRLFAKNVTIMAAKCNDFEAGRKYWDRQLEIDELTNDDKYDYAAYCLKTANFEEWWKYFDSRFQKEHNRTQFPQITKPRWDGEKDLSESTLLVHYEQGFGDTFLMWGYFPRLLKLAKRVIYVVQDGVYPLLKNNNLGVEIIPQSKADLKKIKFNYYIPSMSVPLALKVNRQTVGVGEGFITPDDELVEKFRAQYFDNDKFKIGIAFSGSVVGNHTRDIPIKAFGELDLLRNAELYCLTKDVSDTSLEVFQFNKVHNIAKKFNDFADTAAAIANCDIVITGDNCILNLAGGLGKKTYALFNWTHEFRWFDLTGDDVVWLSSVKPYVCDDIDDWEQTMHRVIEDVRVMHQL